MAGAFKLNFIASYIVKLPQPVVGALFRNIELLPLIHGSTFMRANFVKGLHAGAVAGLDRWGVGPWALPEKLLLAGIQGTIFVPLGCWSGQRHFLRVSWSAHWASAKYNKVNSTSIECPRAHKRHISFSRITSRFPDDPRQPFWNETGAPMKPLAKLTLTRQRLYRKSCTNVEDVPFSEAASTDFYDDRGRPYSFQFAFTKQGAKSEQKSTEASITACKLTPLNNEQLTRELFACCFWE